MGAMSLLNVSAAEFFAEEDALNATPRQRSASGIANRILVMVKTPAFRVVVNSTDGAILSVAGSRVNNPFEGWVRECNTDAEGVQSNPFSQGSPLASESKFIRRLPGFKKGRNRSRPATKLADRSQAASA